MRRLFIAGMLVVLFVAGCSGSVAISPAVQKQAIQLRQINRVESSAIGYSGGPSNVYAVYEKMRAAASEEELRALSDDPSPAVRVYALWGLLSKFPKVNAFPIVMAHLEDTEEVETLFGCIGGQRSEADLMLDEIREDLSDDQREKLANWLLSHPNDLSARRDVLTSGSLGPKHHDAVRRLAKEGVDGALQALAGYHDPADAPIILNHLDPNSLDALTAVHRFPNPSFFGRLEAMQKHFKDLKGGSVPEQEQYYLAVAAYQTPKARDILLSVFTLPRHDTYREYATEAAFTAAIRYRCKLYLPALMDMWEDQPVPHLAYSGPADGPFPEDELVEALFNAYPKRTLKIIEGQFDRNDFNFQSEFALRAMCRVLLREMKTEQAFAIINRGLLNG